MIEAKAKQWGNSLGVVIPKEVVETLHLRAGEGILITVEKKENPLKELFGAGLKFKKPTEQLLTEFRKEFESKWM